MHNGSLSRRPPREMVRSGAPVRLPKWALALCWGGGGIASLIPEASTGFLEVARAVLLLAGIFGAIAVAAWAESRVYNWAARGGAFKRTVIALLVPWAGLMLLAPALTAIALLTGIVVNDVGAFALLALAASFWFISAAVGSATVVVIEVAVSRAVADFRSRLQLMVMALLVGGVTSVVFLLVAARRIAVHVLTQASDKNGKLTFDVGDEPFVVPLNPSARDITGTEDFIAYGIVFLLVAALVPAVLSATGKIADGVVARLFPLTVGFDRLSAGDVEVRVEEGGSEEFVVITQGFNRMAGALGKSFADLETRNRELVDTNEATRRFVPSQFLELLSHDSIREVARGDQVELDMTVVFCDLRGFTPMAEALGSADTFAIINRYLAYLEPPVLAEGGFVNDVFGDGVMVLFPNGAAAAVRAVRGMVAAIHRLNTDANLSLRAGIGIHSGPLMLGTVGGETRLSCTVIGDTANTASRIESATKKYGATVLASEAVLARLEAEPELRADFREIDRVVPKGKVEAMRLYQDVSLESAGGAALRATSVAFAEALAAYRKGAINRARAAFRECQPGQDAVASFYVAQCDHLLRTGVPPGWDGLTRHASK